MKLNDLIGQEVKLYPGDTYSKWAKILDIADNGILFEITRSNCENYKVGTIRFISYSANLTFEYKGIRV